METHPTWNIFTVSLMRSAAYYNAPKEILIALNTMGCDWMSLTRSVYKFQQLGPCRGFHLLLEQVHNGR